MARAGIALTELPRPEYAERCERGFALQMRRDKGTVELTGFYFIEEHRFIMGFGWGRNPLRWFWDQRRLAHNQPLLAEWTSQRNRGSPLRTRAGLSLAIASREPCRCSMRTGPTRGGRRPSCYKGFDSSRA